MGEPAEHAYPKTKLAKFDKGLPVSVDLSWYVRKLRDTIVRQLSARKIRERGPRFRRRMPVHALAGPDVSAAVLKHIAAMLGLRIKHKGTQSWLELRQLKEVSQLALIHAGRPHAGFGALRIKCGEDTYDDMMMAIPPLKLTATASGGFEMELTTVVFDGGYGTPDFPKVDDADELLDAGERNHVVEYARSELKQRWHGIPHPLVQKGWANLPKHVHSLSKAVAYPAHNLG